MRFRAFSLDTIFMLFLLLFSFTFAASSSRSLRLDVIRTLYGAFVVGLTTARRVAETRPPPAKSSLNVCRVYALCVGWSGEKSWKCLVWDYTTTACPLQPLNCHTHKPADTINHNIDLSIGLSCLWEGLKSARSLRESKRLRKTIE